MAFQKLLRGFGETVEFVKKGDSVTAYLVSVRNGVGKNKSNVYDLQRANGVAVSMWGSGAIDFQLLNPKTEQIEPHLVGKLIRVTFQGVRKLKGKRTLKVFDVEVDESKSIKVSKKRGGKVPF